VNTERCVISRLRTLPEAIAALKNPLKSSRKTFWMGDVGLDAALAGRGWSVATVSALSGAGFGCPQCLRVVYLVSGELTAAVVVHTWAAILDWE